MPFPFCNKRHFELSKNLNFSHLHNRDKRLSRSNARKTQVRVSIRYYSGERFELGVTTHVSKKEIYLNFITISTTRVLFLSCQRSWNDVNTWFMTRAFRRTSSTIRCRIAQKFCVIWRASPTHLRWSNRLLVSHLGDQKITRDLSSSSQRGYLRNPYIQSSTIRQPRLPNRFAVQSQSPCVPRFRVLPTK